MSEMVEPTIVAVAGARFEPLDIEEQVLAPAGAVLRRTPGRTENELVEGCRGARAVLASAQPRFTPAVLSRLDGVRAVVRYGVGVDSIDLAAAFGRGILVCNVPHYSTEEVALHAVTLALALVRRLDQAVQDTRAGHWDLGRLRPMHSATAYIAGVVGLGRIGCRAARYLTALGFRVQGFDPFISAAMLAGEPIAVRDSLEALLADADLVTLHLPATRDTHGLIGRERLRAMKPGALLVNTARGELVDEEALAEALDEGRLGGAALDVLAEEPPRRAQRLLSHPRVIVTPHAAWYTVEAERRLRLLAAEEVKRILEGHAPLNAVNAC
jgi:D-3-phosphoglycerate dehydrogenase